MLSHVCSNWRRVAIDTPSLWRDIDISLSMEYDALEHFCSSVFPRVKGHPCTIRIRDINFIGMDDDNEHPVHCCKILPDMEVTELKICFRVQGEYDDPELIEYLEGVEGKVRGLVLDSGTVDDGRMDEPWDLWRVVSPLSHLRRISLWCVDATLSVSSQTLPLIEELEMENVEGSLALGDLLHMFPNLRRFKFTERGDRYWDVNETRSRAATHSKLREMHFTSVDMIGWASTGATAARSLFPSLIHLEVHDDTDLDIFLEERTHRRVRRLVVGGAKYESREEYLATLR